MPDDDPLLANLAKWASEQRADDAATQRSRERWLLQQAEEGARLSGLLVDLAERAASTVIQTSSGRTRAGRIAAVAHDFVVVRNADDDVFIPMSAIASIKVEAETAPLATSTRSATLPTTFVNVIAGLAGERPRVRLDVRGHQELVTGELRSVGADVVTVKLDGPTGNAYVPIGAIVELRSEG